MATAFDLPANPAVGQEATLPSGFKMRWNGLAWEFLGTTFDVNAYVQKAGDTMTGSLKLAGNDPQLVVEPVSPTQNALIQINKTSVGVHAYVRGMALGKYRWGITLANATPESGANAGSDFGIDRYADDGAFLHQPVFIERATGKTMLFSSVHPQLALKTVNAAAHAALRLVKGNSGYVAMIEGFTGSDAAAKLRWQMMLGNGDAESGGNAGSNFSLTAWDDNGLNPRIWFSIGRASGNATFGAGAYVKSFLVAGDAATNGSLQVNKPAGGESQVKFLVGNVQRWYIAHGANDLLAFCRCDAGGNFLSAPLTINPANADVTATGNFFAGIQGWKPGGGSWADSSDARIKDNIEDYTTGLDAVLALRPRTFTFKPETGRDASVVYTGLIAQEAEGPMPELVTKRAFKLGELEFEDMRTLDGTPLVYALVNSVKELAARNAALEQTLADLMDRVLVLEGAA